VSTFEGEARLCTSRVFAVQARYAETTSSPACPGGGTTARYVMTRAAHTLVVNWSAHLGSGRIGQVDPSSRMPSVV